MPVFSEATIESVRQANDIVDVISSYIPLNRAGANFRALCPFHKEKTPSFNVNPQQQIFKCFGCGVGGNVLKFVQLYENVDFLTALRMLAERARIPLETSGDPSRERKNQVEKDSLYQIHEDVANYYHHLLLKDPAAEVARSYLQNRRISSEMIKLFRLGYSPNAWDGLIQWAKSRQISCALIEKAGLIVPRNQNSKASEYQNFYDRFRGRLMFPICNEQGKVVGFSGRILDPETKEAKYVNSPETLIFNKSKILFGFDKTKRDVLEAKHVVICEGQLDLITAFQSGIRNLVAPQGTAFTEEQGRILKRYTNEAILCFDSDAAGQKAAVRTGGELIQTSLTVRVATIPQPHDPDSYLKEHGPEKFREFLASAKPYYEYLLEFHCAQNDIRTDSGQLTVTRSLVQALAECPEEVIRMKYIPLVATRLKIHPETVQIELKKHMRNRGRNTSEPQNPKQVQGVAAPTIEQVVYRELLHLMLHDSSVVQKFASRIAGVAMPDLPETNLIQKIALMHQTGGWSGTKSLSAQELELSLVQELIMLPLKRPELSLHTAESCLIRLVQYSLKEEMEMLQEQLNTPGITLEEQQILTKQILDLKGKLNEIHPLAVFSSN